MTPKLRSSTFRIHQAMCTNHTGGWIWTLHFDHQVASAGVVFSEQHPRLKQATGDHLAGHETG